MTNLGKIRLISILGIIVFYYWLYFECQKNVASHDSLAFSFLIHSLAFIYSLSYFKFVKIPFVCVLSALNIVGFAIAPANVDFEIFQLGKFNPDMFFHINLGYIIFYVGHFVFLNAQIHKYKKIDKYKYHAADNNVLKQLGLLQNYSLFFYIISRTLTLPISGLNEFIELVTIGSFLIGFFLGSNSLIKNIIAVTLIFVTVIQILIGGLIYPIIFFGIFMSALVFQYGIKTYYAKISIISGILFVTIFTVLFNPVKMEFRLLDLSGKSSMERLGVIYELILNNKSSASDIEDDKSTFWRLTYPMSAISMVNEKTPSKVPYWDGESYINLLYKFIPRFLWKEKPTEEMGQLFGHRYEVLDKWNLTTSMNTPILTEAYMNFGWLGFYGVFILMALILARAVISSNIKSVKSDGSLKELLHGLNVAIVLSFLIQWESNFSLVFGKLIILVIINFLIEWLSFRKQDSNKSLHHLRLAGTKN